MPHFEKMLYDQAQLAVACLEAYQITRRPDLAAVARETLGYVLRSLTGPEGGFYSAEDAESAPDPARPDKKEEGAFYVWSRAGIERTLGKERADSFAYAYGVARQGDGGRNILFAAHRPEEVARRFGRGAAEVERILADARALLLAERERRPRPHLDDKVLVSWNGLAISAFARAYQVLDDAAYLKAAERAARLIRGKLYDAAARRLLRSYRDGAARHDATLQDYAFLTMALIDLYEASLDIQWLRWAIDLGREAMALFFDVPSGGFFDTSGKDRTLLVRTREDYDGPEPSGNSIAIANLLRLAEMTDSREWRAAAERSFGSFGERVKQNPDTMPQLLAALDFQLSKPVQIVIAGDPRADDTRRLLAAARAAFVPNKVLLCADGGAGEEFLAPRLPVLKVIKRIGGRATAYVCENYACKLPTTEPRVLAAQLEKRPAP